MNDGYLQFVDLGISLIESLIAHYTKSNAPAEVIDALRAAVAAIDAHKNDTLTKANLDALRG